ncbi:hypothetical protein RJ640_007760, partial [Escallonia rubra]
ISENGICVRFFVENVTAIVAFAVEAREGARLMVYPVLVTYSNLLAHKGIKIYLEFQMQSRPLKLTIKVKKEDKKEKDDTSGSTCPDLLDSNKTEPNDFHSSTCHVPEASTFEKPVDITSLDEDNGTKDEGNQSSENAQNQLVVYEPTANGESEIVAVPDPNEYQPAPLRRHPFQDRTSRVLPSVGAFTVQCASCFQWRLIPTKEKYEEIREHISEQPFVCQAAREWRPEISCEDPPDILQDGSRLWAIDKPDIAQPPPGWQRLLRIRGEGSSKFADVYYVAPSGKRLRSMVEIQRYLLEHPEFMDEGVTMSQFSFQIPRPLQENYVRKRPARLTAPFDGNSVRMPGSLEPSEGPNENTDLRLGGPAYSGAPYFEAPVFDPVGRPTKKTRIPPKAARNGDSLYKRDKVKVEDERRFYNGNFDL